MTVEEERHGPGGHVLILTIGNEPVNALDADTRRGLIAAFEGIAAQVESTHVVVLRGAAGRFSAGGDIREMLVRNGPDGDRALHESFSSLYRTVLKCPVPVIAIITGYAMGGGLELALNCDLRYAAADARLAASGVNMGLVESVHTLSRVTTAGFAAELLLSGAPVTGAEAARTGLVTRSLPSGEVEEYAMAVAERIASRPPRSVRATKEVLQLAAYSAQQASELASRRWLELRSSRDHEEALCAFQDHREPQFEGR